MSSNLAATQPSPREPDDRRIAPGPQPVPSIGRGAPAPGRAHKGRRRWVYLLAGALVLAGIAGEAWRATHAAGPVHYVTAPVTRGSVTRAVTASGSVNPVTTIQVGTYVSGVIQELYCDFNTVVRKGQLCAKIDPRPYQTVVDQDRANLSTARAQLAKDQTNFNYAKLTYQRTQDLRTRGLVSQDQLDSAKNAFDQAQAQVQLDASGVEQHDAALKAAQINLAYTDIKSPVDGTVVSRNVTMGQTVAASFQTPTLFLIATDLTKMQVDSNVSESDIGGVKAGEGAAFTVDAFPNRTFKGQVAQVRQAPQTVQNVVTYDVVVSVDNPDLLLKPGMTATVKIITANRDNALRVPDAALRYTPGGMAPTAGAVGTAGSGGAAPGGAARAGAPRDGAQGNGAAGPGAPRGTGGHTHRQTPTQVWVLRNGQPVAVSITTGLNDDTYAEITSGELQPGDQVITSEERGSGSSGANRTGSAPRLRL